jgi:hypothetical protein
MEGDQSSSGLGRENSVVATLSPEVPPTFSDKDKRKLGVLELQVSNHPGTKKNKKKNKSSTKHDAREKVFEFFKMFQTITDMIEKNSDNVPDHPHNAPKVKDFGPGKNRRGEDGNTTVKLMNLKKLCNDYIASDASEDNKAKAKAKLAETDEHLDKIAAKYTAWEEEQKTLVKGNGGGMRSPFLGADMFTGAGACCSESESECTSDDEE